MKDKCWTCLNDLEKCMCARKESDVAAPVKRLVMPKVVANDTIREIIEQAHMAGQNDAGVDPSYSNAQIYCNSLFSDECECEVLGSGCPACEDDI